jgi:RNA polymerase sigma-70 factor (ECF subfamily)
LADSQLEAWDLNRKIDAAAMAIGGKELAAGMASGLFELVEKLYEEHYDGLYRYLLLHGCHASDADDCVQEAFLRLYRALRTGVRVKKPKSWLIGTLHHILADESRAEMRRIGADDTALEEYLAQAHEPAADAETECIERERRDQIREAVNGLTPRQYEYLMQRAAGLKLREIAALHGVSVQTVAEACARAMEKLGSRFRR